LLAAALAGLGRLLLLGEQVLFRNAAERRRQFAFDLRVEVLEVGLRGEAEVVVERRHGIEPADASAVATSAVATAAAATAARSPPAPETLVGLLLLLRRLGRCRGRRFRLLRRGRGGRGVSFWFIGVAHGALSWGACPNLPKNQEAG